MNVGDDQWNLDVVKTDCHWFRLRYLEWYVCSPALEDVKLALGAVNEMPWEPALLWIS